ncbi:MAG: response regulator transcription factor [Gemmatimonadaceae bacterium]
MPPTPLVPTNLHDATPSSSPFSVMCIDDNELLVDALERRLDLEPGFTGFHRVLDFALSVEGAVQHHPSIVLLDIDLPGDVDALRILADLVARVPASRVIVFTGYPSGELLEVTLSLGAWGFVSKGVSAERLIGAIRRVSTGEAVIELEE